MHLALFDLDHTLIPFDSGSLFTRFLIERGALPAAFEAQYLEHCRAYAAGTVDMVAMHRFTVGALAVHEPARLAGWLQEFRAEAAPRVPASAHALVQQHREQGHTCVLVTATSRLVSQAFGTLLGFEHVLATEPARDGAGRVTGEVLGVPCFREHKLTHLQAWLDAQGHAAGTPARSWFYSDSHNDLPLLQWVSNPVAVNPDARLAALAHKRGWPVLRIE
jgi:HAD superfamily hydrolase (TIGR01490 family)